jgi:Asp-tRNA(Asn)/Glu-tRNA(Gln) amidotransferase B subunit
MHLQKFRSDHTEIASANAVICVLLDLMVHTIYNYASDAGRDPQQSLNWIYDELQRALAETKLDMVQDPKIELCAQNHVKEQALKFITESFQQAADLLEIPAPR